MHRTIGYLSKRFVQLQPGEGRKVFLTFLYFFLAISASYVVKPVSRSLILNKLGYRMVPSMDLLAAILIGPVVTLFARLVERVSRSRLVDLSFAAMAILMLLFWRLLHGPPPAWAAAAFYVWVCVFSVLAVVLFWCVANDFYRPRDAKRLFGFIGSAGMLGGITGASVAAVGAQLVGTNQLLLFSTGLLILSWLVVQRLWRYAPTPALPETGTLAARRHETFLSNPRGFLRLLGSSRYLLLLIAIVGLNAIVASLVYYQFNPFIEQTFRTLDATTTFTGIFLGAVNVVAFAVQFGFTSWVLRRWGWLVASLVLPLGLLAGSTGLLVAPLFSVAAATELSNRSLDYSLNNTAREVLYLPIDRSIRDKVKPFLDTVVLRMGKGIAAVLGIVLLNGLDVPARWLSLLTIPLVLLWVMAVIWMRREYATTIRTILQARAAARRVHTLSAPAALQGADEDIDPGLGSLMVRPSPDAKLSLAARLVAGSSTAAQEKELLAAFAQRETPLSASSRLGPGFEVQRLKATIQNRANAIALRRQAIRLLARRADQDALDYLCGILLVEDEVVLRHEAVRGLVKISLDRHGLHPPVPLIRRQIAREVKHYEHIAQVGAVYRQHHRGSLEADDPVIGLLRVLLEESVEQIFRLLMLLYRPEDIHLVYEQLRAADTYVRADAIELLDNLIDPKMRATIFPILDEDRFLSLLDEPSRTVHEPTLAYRLLQEAIWDHNCWLSVTTLCAVGRLRLTTLRQELEKASRHTEPLVSMAADIALHFPAS